MLRFSYKKAIALLLALALSGSIIAFAEQNDTNDEPTSSDIPVITVSSEPESELEASSEAHSSSISSASSDQASSGTESAPPDSSDTSSAATSSTVHSLPVSSAIVSTTSSKATSSRPKQPTPTISPEWNDNLNEILNNAADWLKNNEEGSLYFIALGSAGKSIDSQRYEILFNQIASLDDTATDLYELSLYALNSTFCGVNAARVRNKNLIEMMSQFSEPSSCDTTTLVYSLLAFDCNQYADDPSAAVNRDVLLELLLARQQVDGSFLAAKDENPVTLTAFALTALSGYSDRTAVKDALSQGLEYIRLHYTTTSFETESSDVFSQIIIAMNCLGINVNDSRFMKSRENIDDILLDYLGDDGGFKQNKGDSVSNTRSTELAVIALSSVKYFSNPYVLRQNLTEVSSAASKPPSLLSGPLSSNWLWLILPGSILLVAVAVAGVLIYRKKKKDAPLSDQ